MRITPPRLRAALALAALPGIAAVTVPPPPGPSERVEFPRGTGSRLVRGAVKGDTVNRHIVAATAGQTLAVAFRSSNAAGHFSVTDPAGETLFDGTDEGDSFSSELADAGDYQVNVFLEPGAARAGETGTYTLSVGLL